jgi:hypothetical protein
VLFRPLNYPIAGFACVAGMIGVVFGKPLSNCAKISRTFVKKQLYGSYYVEREN